MDDHGEDGGEEGEQQQVAEALAAVEVWCLHGVVVW